MEEKNTLSILESIKQKMMKFEQDPEKNENIFDEIKEFEYSDNSSVNIEENHENVSEAKIITENIESEEDSKFDLDLEDYEGEEDDLLQDNGNFLFENHKVSDVKQVQNSQNFNSNQSSVVQKVPENNDQIINQTQEKNLDAELEFDLDELEKEFLIDSKIKNEQKSSINNKEFIEEGEDFLKLDGLEDLEETPSKKESISTTLQNKDDEFPEIDLDDESFIKDNSKTNLEKENIEKLDNEIDSRIDDDEEDEILFKEDSDINKDQNNQTPVVNNSNGKFEVINSGSNSQNSYSMPLITKDTLHQTTESIRKLMDASNVINGIKTFSQQAPFNEIALQLMEPKLEKWLNDHLPELVEKIVREEISRIIPKIDEEKK